jgi:acetyl esterase/lipase
VSPLRADLIGPPSTTIVLAERDPIGVQGRLYGEALAASGVTVAVQEPPGMIHGFFRLDEAVLEATETMAFVSRQVTAATAPGRRRPAARGRTQAGTPSTSASRSAPARCRRVPGLAALPAARPP